MIYINDLSTPVPLYKYVDDSTLFEICEINSISLMQESVNIAAEWTNNNDMKINSENSKEMIIIYAHCNIGNEVPNILIDGKVVGYYIVQRFDMEEACGQHCEESGKENLYVLSVKTSRC